MAIDLKDAQAHLKEHGTRKPHHAPSWDFIKINDCYAVAGDQGDSTLLVIELENTSHSPDYLEDACINPVVSQVVQMHLVSPPHGMIPVDAIPIYPMATMKLPGTQPNYHVMLIKLTRDLASGEKINVALHFRLMGTVHLQDVPVQ